MTPQMPLEQQLSLQTDMLASLEAQRNAALNEAARQQAFAQGNARIAEAFRAKVTEQQTKIDELQAQLDDLTKPAATPAEKPAATPIKDAVAALKGPGGEQP